MFSVENFPSSSDSEEFKVYADESMHILKDYYQDDENTARNQWDNFCFEMIFFNWYSLHARLNSHYEAWSYKKKKLKKVKAYRKSI